MWAELDELFLPDAEVVIDRRSIDPVTLTGPGQLGQFIADNLEQFAFFEFVILNVRLRFYPDSDRDAAIGRMYMSELRQDHGGRATTVYGLYQDRYRRVDGRWWFAGRRYTSFARSSDTEADLDVFGLPASLADLRAAAPERRHDDD